MGNDEVDSNCGSYLDKYDLENGYVTEEEIFEKNNNIYRDLLFQIYRIGINKHRMSFSEMEEIDIFSYIDFIIFELENPIENNYESEVV